MHCSSDRVKTLRFPLTRVCYASEMLLSVHKTKLQIHTAYWNREIYRGGCGHCLLFGDRILAEGCVVKKSQNFLFGYCLKKGWEIHNNKDNEGTDLSKLMIYLYFILDEKHLECTAVSHFTVKAACIKCKMLWETVVINKRQKVI